MPPLACLHPSKFSSCSWHKKPTLVELETESSAIYFGEESKTADFQMFVMLSMLLFILFSMRNFQYSATIFQHFNMHDASKGIWMIKCSFNNPYTILD